MSKNNERSHWRTKCRDKLAHYLSKQILKVSDGLANIASERVLDLDVSPADIRLNAGPGGQYRWECIPGKEDIFNKSLLDKHLSKLSVGPLMDLYRGVGETFRAVEMSADTGIEHAVLTPDHNKGVSRLNACEEVSMLRAERNELVEKARCTIKHYRREHHQLKRENEKYTALIAKHRELMMQFLQDTARTTPSLSPRHKKGRRRRSSS